VTKAVARIHLGLQDRLELGNVDSKRDWGHARDYAECMWRILQLDEPGDFVVATGELRSVRQLVNSAFKHVDRRLEWSGEGDDVVAREADGGAVRVVVNPQFYRPLETAVNYGDASKVRRATGWRPSTSFDEMISEMMEKDLREAEKELRQKKEKKKVCK